jgi:hypothetical protein
MADKPIFSTEISHLDAFIEKTKQGKKAVEGRGDDYRHIIELIAAQRRHAAGMVAPGCPKAFTL